MGNERLLLVALCAVMAQSAQAALTTAVIAPDAPTAKLEAIVSVGTTTTCGMREAPHLIEHLLLSGTEYGETPVDAVITLRSKGIKLSAVTRSDFTQFTLEGPPNEAKTMESALATFLGRPSLPKIGIEREKHAILHELRAPESYVSSPSFYERFIAISAGGTQPCVADKIRFLSYTLDDMQAVYDQFYTASNIRLVAKAMPDTFDLDGLGLVILAGHDEPSPNTHDRVRENGQTISVLGTIGQVEIIFPIAGRQTLPVDEANAYADQARLELQAYVRREYQLYTVCSFVEQSIRGGWIRLEIPGLTADKGGALKAVAIAAMANVNPNQFGNDPVWKAYGAQRVSYPIGTPLMAEAQSPKPHWASSLKDAFLRIMEKL